MIKPRYFLFHTFYGVKFCVWRGLWISFHSPDGSTEGKEGGCDVRSWLRATSLECVLNELLSTSSRLGRLTPVVAADAALPEDRPLVPTTSSEIGVVTTALLWLDRERGGKRVLAGKRSSATGVASSRGWGVVCKFSWRPRNLHNIIGTIFMCTFLLKLKDTLTLLKCCIEYLDINGL